MLLPPFRPMGNRRALLIAIRSVADSDLPNLDLTHRDAKDLYHRLTFSYGYQPDDVTLMIDDRRHPEHLWPTHKKILHQIDQLTHDTPDDCQFFFYFSGHGLEEECTDRASSRADGCDDEIVCADGKPILDHILHDRLITPLEKVKGSKLFALLDCCHSETLLDLQRGKAPKTYSRVWSIGRDQFLRGIVIAVSKFLQLHKRNRQSNCTVAVTRKSTGWASEPTSEAHEIGELSVICLSACRDWQLAHDDCGSQLTFTKCFMEVLSENPNISWTDLRDTLKNFIWKIRERIEQEPRISTNSYTDLRQTVADFIGKHQ